MGERPSQDSGRSQPPAGGRQTVPAEITASGGQAAEAPSQTSARSQAPLLGLQGRPARKMAQTPSTIAPARTEQASQAPPQAELQQTPSAQKPLAQAPAK